MQTPYDVIIFKFQGGASAPPCTPLPAPMAADDDDNAQNFLFSINSDAYFNATVDVYGLDVTTRITGYDFTVALNRTEIGDVNVGRVHVMLDIAMVTAVVQRLNQLGQRGVRLPMIKHVSYGQPLMTLYDDCVFVG